MWFSVFIVFGISFLVKLPIMEDKNSVIGILGGMGPEATLECFHSIIEQTPADKDQDHLQVLINNNPAIPDRTEAILSNGNSPVSKLRQSALTLQKAGASFIIMPCNTAHYFLEEIQNTLTIPILNMIGEVSHELRLDSKVGLVATTGTIKTGIYDKYLRENDIEIVTPQQDYQKEFMDIIYGKKGVKAGYKTNKLKKRLLRVIDNIFEQIEVEKVIAGCTEVRLILEKLNGDKKLVKPIDVIVKSAVNLALEKRNSDI